MKSRGSAAVQPYLPRGTGITVFLHNGGSLEAAQEMANHSDPRTTKLYDRSVRMN